MTVVKGSITIEKVTGVIMFVTMANALVAWLEEEMAEKGWSSSELSRRSGISQPMISLVLSGKRGPGNEFCDGIARAFKLPPETIYQKAGLLPVKPNDDETVTELTHIFHDLSDENRQDVLDYARLRQSKQEREKHGKRK